MGKFDKKNIQDIFALTPMQEGMLFHYLKKPGSNYYSEQLSLKIMAEVDLECFKRAWDYVVQGNEMLRTCFRWEKLDRPAQVVLKQHNPDPGFFDLSYIEDHAKQQKQLEKIKLEDRKEKFDLREVPFRVILCKVSEKDYHIVISNHHILFDGWSSGIILKEFFEAYDGLCKGNILTHPIKTKTKFKEFIKWNQKKDTGKQENFWRNYLKGFDAQTGLSIKRERKGKKITGPENFRIRFEKDLKAEIDGFVKKHKMTLASLLYSAWGLLLQKYNNTNDVVFGTTVSGRGSKVQDIENIVGLFINTIPLRVYALSAEKIEDLLYRIDYSLKMREEYEQTSLVNVKEYSEVDNNEELFDSIVVIENYPLSIMLREGTGKLSVDSYSMVEMTHYDLTVGITIFDDIEFKFIYNKEIFDENTIVRFSDHITSIVRDMIRNPGKKVSYIEIISEDEKSKILYEFNNTDTDYPKDKTIHELFEEQAEKNPDSTALMGRVPDPGRFAITYRGLNEKSNQLANQLRKRGIKTGTIVPITVERSPGMIIGIMAILKAGGAYLPMDPQYPESRSRYMLADSGAKVLVTTSTLAKEGEKLRSLEVKGDLETIFIDSHEFYNFSSSHLLDFSTSSSLAYIIYTSGTTGRPKGVMVEHRSVVNLLLSLADAYPFEETDTWLLKTSYMFDVSAAELFGWFLGGGRIALLEKGGEKDPRILLETIAEQRITHINFVPAMFNLLVNTLSPRNVFKLSGLKYIFLAGEALFPQPINRLKELNPHLPLENLYGPTEATVYASSYSLSAWDGVSSIPIGGPLNNLKLYIVDNNHHLQPVGIAGELTISGVGLARGYLNNPRLTCEKFKRAVISHSSFVISSSRKTGDRSSNLIIDDQCPMTNDRSPQYPITPLPHSRIYRTGDLARWFPDDRANIEFLGRIDQQVKIRGFRIELGEIETQLLRHPGLREAVALVLEKETGDKYICAYIVPAGSNSSAFGVGASLSTGLRRYLSNLLPDHMVPSYFVEIDKIPLTPSGKVDRKALPTPVLKAGEDYIAPRDTVEEKLAGIWSMVLGIEKDLIGIDGSFFELGGHSLNAIVMTAKIHKELNVKIPLAELFKTPRIRGLSRYIKTAAKDRYTSIEPVEKKEYYVLSSAQKRLYILQQMEFAGTAYNMPGIIPLEEEADMEKFAETFKKVIHRHESFRTSFHMINEKPVQRTHNKVEFKIEYDDMKAPTEITRAEAGIHHSFVRPFDLTGAPLLRAAVFKTPHGQNLLLVDMHHIISDGISHQILINEFTALYEGNALPPLRIRYKDFSNWQNSERQKENLKQQETYWLKEFAGEIPVIDLPLDYSRPVIQEFAGSSLTFEIPAKESEALKTIALAHGSTLYMMLLSIFTIFLSRLTGQEDIIIGTPVAGRRHADLEKVIGMFVNTLALRNFPAGEKIFKEFLQQVKEGVLEAFENQDYQFEDLVEQAAVIRDAGRNPLFDVMFSLQNIGPNAAGAAAPAPHPGETQDTASKFDITLTVNESPRDLVFLFTYNTALFNHRTIERFTDYFKKVISTVTRRDDIKLSQIEIISAGEKEQLLYDFNDTETGYPAVKTVHQLFKEQAEKNPDSMAVVGMGPGAGTKNRFMAFVSFKELNEKSNRLASLLQTKGIGTDAVVAIMTDPCPEMMIGIMAVLKAGACYLPIDPVNPGARIQYLLSDSETKLLLTQTGGGDKVAFSGETLNMEEKNLYRYNREFGEAADSSRPGDSVYMIYTSGTSGKPKGVLLEHRNLVNYVHWFSTAAGLTGEDKTALTSSFAFDLGYTSIYTSLLNGAPLHILAKETYMLPPGLLDYISLHGITYLKMTPSLFSTLTADSHFSGQICRGLRLVVLGGEAINPADVEKAYRICRQLRVMNHYGPTEVTIGCIARFIEPGDLDTYKIRPTIGGPIFNTRVYILDRYLNVLPVGTAGELCLSGAGVAKGYFKQEALTAEKFLPNPFAAPKSGNRAVNDRLYRSGDLARWLPDGNIEFLGRIDQQVKIRGYRIELGEITAQLLEHEDIHEAAALARTADAGNKHLCAYIVPAVPVDIREFLSGSLPEYMVPDYFVPLEKLPLTPNGKLDRKALPRPGIDMSAQYVAPHDPIESKLVEIWSEVLNRQEGQVGVNTNFFELGGNSLSAVIMLSKSHKELNVRIPLAEIFRKPTIMGLAAFIKRTVPRRYVSIEPVEKKEYYALSSAQKRLYILQQIDPGGTAYNMPRLIPLGEEPALENLERVFGELIQRHESLRTSFYLVEETPAQKIHEKVEFSIEYIEEESPPAAGSENTRLAADLINRIIRFFDLSQAPLLRAGVIKTRENHHLLLIDMHHIISDGISRLVLHHDIMTLFQGNVLPAFKIQYRDFSEWQNSEQEGENLKRQEQYWLNEFAGEIPVLDLPTDYIRPAIQSFAGGDVNFEIDAETVGALRAVALAEGATLFMVLLAVFDVLLSKLAGQEDIVVGTPIAGRRHADLQKIIGMFVNTLAIRNYPDSEKTFKEFLLEVKERTLAAFENQEYPFEELVEQVEVNRDAGRNPLFDVMFVLQNIDVNARDKSTANSFIAEKSGTEMERPALTRQPDSPRIGISKFDISLYSLGNSENLYFTFEYCTKLFKKETIERFVIYFKNVVSAIVRKPGLKLAAIDIICEEEKNRLLYDFNDTEIGYPEDKTLRQLFEDEAKKNPNHIAVIFRDKELTYKDLDRESGQLAHLLQSKGVKTNSIVPIMAERSLEMIVAIFAILKAGGAYLPLETGYPPERIRYILSDSGAKVLVTTGTLAKEGEKLTSLEVKGGPETIFIDAHESYNLSSSHLLDFSTSSSLAYVIYTSGSTGNPKGVLVRQGSVVNILFYLFNRYPLLESDTYLFKTSYVFDVSVCEIFGWFWEGGRLAILEPGVEKDPERILQAIADMTVSHINFVPSMFNVFVDFLNPGNIDRLSGLKYIFLAGEALSPRVVNKFKKLGSKIRLENIYGPTEAAIYASGYPLSQWDGADSIPIGKPLPNVKLYILGKSNNLQPIGVLGELCIAGVGLARGYLNNPELTTEKFCLRRPGGTLFEKTAPVKHLDTPRKNFLLKGTDTLSPYSPIYRTGDLARWRPDGNIEFSGRIDHQIKIRGFRIELGEIESALLNHEKIKETVVMTREDENEEKYLCAYVVPHSSGLDANSFETSQLRGYLQGKLPDYMVPTYFAALEEIPLTATGKVDRKSLPQPEIKVGKDYIGPGNKIEKKLVEIWSEVLGRDALSTAPTPLIGIDDNFFDLGGHSLKAIRLIARLHKTFNIEILLAALFKTPTIRGLADCINKAAKSTYGEIKPVEKKEYYSLSSAQKRLFVLHRMDKNSTVYNITGCMMLEGKVERKGLERAFKKVINRHDSLSTSFQIIDNEPVQKIHHEVEFEIEYYEEQEASVINNFIRSFDLSRSPLLRVGLIKQAEEKYILMVDMHHIVADGVSVGIFVKEFMAFSAGKELSTPGLQYKDFSEWQRALNEKDGESIIKQDEYWLNELKGEIPVLELPTDFIRPAVQNSDGNTVDFEISVNDTQALKAYARDESATLFMVLFAIYNIFLSKISNQEDIVIGTPVVGRRHVELSQIIGMFVNTLALRNYPGGEKTFHEFFKEVRENTLAAFENQDYPYEYIVERVVVNRDTSRNPLFDTVFALQDIDIPGVEITGLTLKPYTYKSKTSKFDLTFICEETGRRLLFSVEYCTRLFKEESILGFIGYFKKIISHVLYNRDIMLEEIEILSGEEKARILYEFNNTEAEYPQNKTVHELFTGQVGRSPDHIAVVEPGYTNSLSYKELNRRANRLARVLQNRGVTADMAVGLLMGPRLEMLIAMMAILKTGGAYLPIVPHLPAARQQYMLREAAVRIVLSHGDKASGLNLGDRLILLDEKNFYTHTGGLEINDSDPDQVSRPQNAAYMIYTSGSTGKPKGVIIEHDQLINFIFHMYNRVDEDVSTADNCLGLTEISFDVSVCELFFPLSFGATIVLLAEEAKYNANQLARVILEQKITFAYIPPGLLPGVSSHLKEIAAESKLPLNKMLVGVEPIRDNVLEEYLKLNPGMRLLNGYGPTETTICAAMLRYRSHQPGGRIVPIGSPLSNMQIVILDKGENLVPVKIAGELCASGRGVGRGYLNNPRQTADKFVPNPWFPGERMYKTGDLARWLENGSIEFIGRIDQQVKVRGYRIEPGEIENHLLKLESIQEARVVVWQDSENEKYLCGYIVSKADINILELKKELSEHLPHYMVPSYILQVREIPVTPHGKLDRKALPLPPKQSEIEYAAPGNELEEKLVEIWSGALKKESGAAANVSTGKSHGRIGIDDNFFELGGNSLKAAFLVSKVHKVLDVGVSLVEIFRTPTIRELAAYIKKAAKDKYISIKPVEKKEYYTLSSAQGRQYVLHRMDEQGIGYNIPSVWNMEDGIDEVKFEKNFRKLIRQHESLRTSFAVVEDEPVQKIYDKVEFKTEYYDLTRTRVEVEEEWSPAPGATRQRLTSTIKNFIRPFDLSRAPLFRLGLAVLEKEKYLLLVDMPHIISDGISMNIFMKDFMTLYRGKDLPGIRVQYKDFSEWQSSYKQKALVERQTSYWIQEFSTDDGIPVLNLPGDYPRPAMKSFEGDVVNFALDERAIGILKDFAAGINATFYMAMLSIYTILLSKLSGQEDIVVGAFISGRRHTDLQPIIGMFINTLAIRTYPTSARTFKIFLKEVKAHTLAALENQDVPFEDLVDKLAVKRDTGRNPIFDVVFNLLDRTDDTENTREYDEKKFPGSGTGTAKFDLNLAAIDQGNRCYFTLEYAGKLFKRSTIDRFTGYLNKILLLVTKDPNMELNRIGIISEEEKHRVLYDFNDTNAGYPGNKVLQQLFEEQVEKGPNLVALTGKRSWGDSDGINGEHVHFTYKELNEISNRLAYVLKENGTGPGQLTAVVMERSVEMMIAVMAIIKAGAAYVPLEPYWPERRIEKMLASLNGRCAVVSPSSQSKVETISELLGNPDHILCLDKKRFKEISKHRAKNPKPPIAPKDMAYVIFTSGSTGMPKGVMETHKPVVNIIDWVNKTFSVGPWDKLLFVASLSFDLSVYDIFGILACGGSLRIVSAENINDPVRLLEIIITEGITFWDSAPAALQQLVPFFSGWAPGAKQIRHCWRLVFLSGDWIPVTMPDALKESFPGIRVIGLGGATEATIWSNFYPIEHVDPSWPSIPYGKPTQNARYYILDQLLYPMPIMVAGDLYIGGQCLATAYINEPELTAGKFPDNPFEPHGKIYKTGDMARWFEDGNIQFLGRKDHQVKIRGYRIELEEIESQLLTHHDVKEAVVLARAEGPAGTPVNHGDKYLCAYIVSDKELAMLEVREFLSKAIPFFMVPSYFMQVEKIPLTPNGKVDRKALPLPDKVSAAEYAHPRDEIEKKLAQIWVEVLETDTPIGIDDDFFELGGHSLKATVLVSKIHKALNVQLPLAEIFRTPFIRELAQYINRAAKNKYASIEPVEKKEYYTLSSAQGRQYVLHRMDEQGIGYNIPSVWKMEGGIDEVKLEKALRKLIRQHESLRTSFVVVEDEPVQKIYDKVEFKTEYYDLTRTRVEVEEEWSSVSGVTKQRVTSTIKNFIRPFDLSRAPLFRLGLAVLEKEKYLLMVDMHHIISDGTSMTILVKDFTDLYRGKDFPRPRIQYKDFFQWRNLKKQQKTIKQQQVFWVKEFAGKIPVLELPTDSARPAVQSFEGSSINFEMNKDTIQGLKALTLETGTTMYMILLSIYTIFLSKLSNQEDIVVGSPVAGRRHADLEGIIGMFVNTLALRNYPSGEKTFSEFLHELRKNTLGSFENQEYLYEDLVEKVGVKRDTSRNPLFDTMFVLQNLDAPVIEIPGLKLKPYDCKTGTSKFDMSLYVLESEEKLICALEYSTKIFSEKTIKRFINYFKNIVSSLIANPKGKVCEIEIMSEDDKKLALIAFNETETSYPADKTIIELFEEQTEKLPGKTALIYSDRQLTYRSLHDRVKRIACGLREKGVGSNGIVALMVERSTGMVEGILGILKAGSAYLPIDPDYPGERIKFMLADSGVKILVTTSTLAVEVNENFKVIFIDSFEFPGFSSSDLPIFSTSHPSNLSYITYTSGSTGAPKGVMVEHQSVVNILWDLSRKYSFPGKDNYLLKTTFIFDVSVVELFSWFIRGGQLTVLEAGGEKDPQMILDSIARCQVTHINFVPSMFSTFVYILDMQNIHRLISLRYIFLAGEALWPGLVLAFKRLGTHVALENLYGPTEAAIYTTGYSLQEWEAGGNIPIGKPLANIKLYILNKHDYVQPPGIPGELVIAGAGVARGYLNQPELTAEKFIELGVKVKVEAKEKNKKVSHGQPAMHPCNHASMNPCNHSIAFPNTPTPHRPIYRTGDLVRWLPDGNIEFLGRIDRQVKVRGFRIELGEIENRLLKYPGIKQVVVMCKDNENDDKYIYTYIVTDRDIPVSELKEYLLKHLPYYMIPLHFVRLEKIPLTPTGKIDKRTLPVPEIKAGEGYIPPRDEIEKKLVQIWAEVLGEDTPVGIDDDFFELGGHSLKATVLVSKIHKALNVQLPLAKIFKTPFIRELAQYINRAAKNKYASIEPVEKKVFYILSLAQKRLWFINKRYPGNTSFNMPARMTLYEAVDEKIIRKVLEQLTERHESLRTSFKEIEREPVQIVEIFDPVKLNYEFIDLSPADEVERKSKCNQLLMEENDYVFNLEAAPLFKAKLIKCKEEEYDLLINVHHIISDGWSVEILKEEFNTLYNANKKGIPPGLQPLRIHYKDYAARQNQLLENEEKMGKANEFWKSQLSGNLPVLNLPYDFSHPSDSKESAGYRWVVPEDLTNRLRAMAVEQRASLFMVLLAGFKLVLSNITGQEDIIVAIPAAARQHEGLNSIIGMFVNTLILGNYISADEPFADFFKRLLDKTFNVLEYQDIPLELICGQLEIKYPEVSVFFNMINIGASPGKTLIDLKNYHMENVQEAKFDIVCYLQEYKNGIEINCHYFKDRFKPLTIEKIMNLYMKVLENISARPELKVRECGSSRKRIKLTTV